MPTRHTALLIVAGAICATSLAAQAIPCGSLAGLSASQFPNPKTVIETASARPATVAQPAPPGAPPRAATPALPAHCEVFGRLNDRDGAGGQHYAIRFHMRLPGAWNGKFFFEGGGGSNGNIGSANGYTQGQQSGGALSLGYAVLSQDSGHDNGKNNDPQRNGNLTHGLDAQARLDHGYNSYDQATQAAKALIRLYYGKDPVRSYFVGCSEGGREAMLMSQRFPEHFDGILACAPGFDLPKSAVLGETWTAQTLAALARTMGIYDKDGLPFLNKTFTDEDLELIANSVLNACDALDGNADGIIDNFPACTTALMSQKLTAITCKGPKRNSCLTRAQVDAFVKIQEGPKTSDGASLYSDWAWDRAMGGKLTAQGETYNQGWRVWKMGAFDAPANSAISATMGALSAITLFSTPPLVTPIAGGAPMKALLAIDLNSASARLERTTPEYPVSVASYFLAASTDLTRFRRHNGKLIIVHGVSDPIFSINDTIRWYKELDAREGGRANEFVRLYAVPGMNHCGGGPATDQFDAFTALVDWTERSKAPDRIPATAGPSTPWPGRTRPLCPFPSQARYVGSGSLEQQANFDCRP